MFLKYKEGIKTPSKYILYKLSGANDFKIFIRKVLENQWPEFLNSAEKEKDYDPKAHIDIVQSQF